MRCPACETEMHDDGSGSDWCLSCGGAPIATEEPVHLPVGDATVRRVESGYVLVSSDGSEFPIGRQRPEP